jgi:hypothetical protein
MRTDRATGRRHAAGTGAKADPERSRRRRPVLPPVKNNHSPVDRTVYDNNRLPEQSASRLIINEPGAGLPGAAAT